VTGQTPEPFVTADDVAAHLKFKRRQVLAMRRKGIIPAHPLGTGKRRKVWRYRISEVDAAVSLDARKPSASDGEGDLAEKSSQRTIPGGSARDRKG
jgi:helix-turn-helix protein